MPGNDAPVELQDLSLQYPQLTAESRKTRAGHLRDPAVGWIGDDFQQLFDTPAPDGGNNPELGQICTDRVDDSSLLANEEMAYAMKHQTALLLVRLGRHEPHVGPCDRLANSLRVGAVVLLPLNVGLHIGRRHQSHRMPQRLQLARPIMRGRASLDPHEARRQLPKEGQHETALELTAYDHLAGCIDPMHLKDRLRDIQTNR